MFEKINLSKVSRMQLVLLLRTPLYIRMLWFLSLTAIASTAAVLRNNSSSHLSHASMSYQRTIPAGIYLGMLSFVRAAFWRRKCWYSASWNILGYIVLRNCITKTSLYSGNNEQLKCEYAIELDVMASFFTIDSLSLQLAKHRTKSLVNSLRENLDEKGADCLLQSKLKNLRRQISDIVISLPGSPSGILRLHWFFASYHRLV